MQNPENYNIEKLTVDLVWANIFALIIIAPIIILFGVPYYLLWASETDLLILSKDIVSQDVILGAFVIIGVMILGTVLHELIHGLTWAVFAKNGFKSIKFGILMKMITPYCHCREPLKVGQYILGALMPVIVLGFLPLILAIITGNLYLLIFGIFFTMAAGGDLLIVNLMRKENKDNFVQDHPSEAGCFVFRKIKSPGKPIKELGGEIS